MTARSRPADPVAGADRSSTATSGVHSSTADAAEGAAAQSSTKTYLLVLGDRTLAQEVAFFACERGVEVHVALTGEDGLARAQERAFSAILLHGLLPDTDAIRWLSAASSRTRATPVVVLSSFRGILDTARSRFDVADTLDEPSGVQTLFTALERAERRDKADRAPTLRPTLAARMDEAARGYVLTLSEKLQAIAAALRTHPDTATAEKLAHRLHGTAGCYGFDEVGLAAGALEQALTSRAPAAVVQAALDAVTGAVERAIERARQS